jgi:hypothetical protein
MENMQRFILLIFFAALFVAPFAVRAQDITGVWEGHFVSDNGGKPSMTLDDRYRFEVQIAQHDKSFEAVTYSYLSNVFYGKAAAAGTINIHTGKVLLQEGKLLEVRNGFEGVCTMTCFFTYFKYGGEEFLEGKYVSMALKDSSNCGRGKVLLRKVPVSFFYEEPFVLKREKELRDSAVVKAAPPTAPAATVRATPKVAGSASPKPVPPAVAGAGRPKSAGSVPPAIAKRTPPKGTGATHRPDSAVASAPMLRATTQVRGAGEAARDSGGADMSRKFPNITPPALLTRANPLVRALTVNTKDLVLNIYDDGEIDHDTISVYLDNRQVINHAMLTDRPLILAVHLDESNDFHRLVLVAENEGDIPPNTSLMIVKAGDKEYEVRITSTVQKNAVITFKYVKEK